MDTHFSILRRTVRKNLSRLICAFLQLALNVRFGYGGLHLTSIAQVLPEGRKFNSSYKWLSRFLKCKFFDASSLAECRLAVILGKKPPGWVIVLVDQTTGNGVEVVNAAIPFQGRAVPVAWVDFEYPWKTVHPAGKSHAMAPAKSSACYRLPCTLRFALAAAGTKTVSPNPRDWRGAIVWRCCRSFHLKQRSSLRF